MKNNNTQISEQEDVSLEELLLQSDLLAGMARADGKVLDVETLVANAYFQDENENKSDLVKSHFTYVAQDDDTDLRMNTVMSFMTRLSNDEKHKLLRCLSALAICDGELHPKELGFIKKFAKAMDINISEN